MSVAHRLLQVNHAARDFLTGGAIRIQGHPGEVVELHGLAGRPLVAADVAPDLTPLGRRWTLRRRCFCCRVCVRFMSGSLSRVSRLILSLRSANGSDDLDSGDLQWTPRSPGRGGYIKCLVDSCKAEQDSVET